jgi:hypothetical protein
MTSNSNSNNSTNWWSSSSHSIPAKNVLMTYGRALCNNDPSFVEIEWSSGFRNRFEMSPASQLTNLNAAKLFLKGIQKKYVFYVFYFEIHYYPFGFAPAALF